MHIKFHSSTSIWLSIEDRQTNSSPLLVKIYVIKVGQFGPARAQEKNTSAHPVK